MTSTGSAVDLSNRKTSYVYQDGTLVTYPGHSPVLTKEEADALSIDVVMGSADGWDPRVYTEQAAAPENVKLVGTTLSWDDNNYVLCWAVCKDGNVIAFTTEPTYTVSDTSATYSVRAANEMGGLSEASEANTSSGIINVETNDAKEDVIYNLQGIRMKNATKGIFIINGKKVLK